MRKLVLEKLLSGEVLEIRVMHPARVGAEAKTAGGIIIPDTAQEKPQEGQGHRRWTRRPRRERQADPDRA